jgi:hypothetical protein
MPQIAAQMKFAVLLELGSFRMSEKSQNLYAAKF